MARTTPTSEAIDLLMERFGIGIGTWDNRNSRVSVGTATVDISTNEQGDAVFRIVAPVVTTDLEDAIAALNAAL